ncbi:alpha/beta hydrolase [Actinoplanes hulinensis]|uniref:Alpha/beta hydrolase n=1 Tax=Actinoplanes hulinensis TaxID=1144547 RepID=A0ABS7BFZ0_9ACTN|nr:alpha/beta hydrolase [Actinoplanes hulinensis]MBW6439775.1 alpha/beta hydrolase [Actinoplanes hulinensis]
MPFGFVFPVVLLTVATLAVLVLPRRSRVLGGVDMWAGLVLSELSQLAFYLLALTTVLTVAGGDITSPAGWIMVAVAVLCLVGLALIFARGLRARAVVRDFLRTAGLAAPERRWPWARIMLTPFLRRRGDVEHLRGLDYGPGGRRQQLDLYRHRSAPAGAPILIHFHGGHFATGHKDSQSLPLLYQLAAEGWVCISANYRLKPEFGFHDHLSDAKRVIAWAREHGPEHGGDPATVVVAGSSAGAHLAALCALTPGDPRFQPGFEAADTGVAAAVSLGGYLGELDRDLDVPTSPEGYLRPDAPPFLIVHGGNDLTIPAAAARGFAERLAAVSTSPVHFLELPYGQHTFDLFHSPRFEAVIDAVAAFGAATKTPG